LSPSHSSSSISFLDLLTCGLGGILLLFFIVVAIRQQSDLNGQEMERGHADNEQSIVMIHLASRDGEPLFESTGGTWLLKKNDEDLARPAFVEMSLGSSFAVFYSVQPLPSGTKLWLSGIRSDAPFESIVTDRFGSAEYDSTYVQQSGLMYTW